MALALKPENIVQLVFFVRGEKVMFDADLAKLYGVATKALNQAFRRNKQRFPTDFVFQLSSTEYNDLKSQIVTSSAGGTNKASRCSRVFSGARTFVQLRRLMDTNRDLARKIESLEKRYDEQFAEVFAAIKELVAPPATPRKQIGFHP
jgi:ORF6N domain-containing protein